MHFLPNINIKSSQGDNEFLNQKSPQKETNEETNENNIMSQFENNENFEFCPHCSRKFFIGRLKPHLKSCTHSKPYKNSKKILIKHNDDFPKEINSINLNESQDSCIEKEYNPKIYKKSKSHLLLKEKNQNLTNNMPFSDSQIIQTSNDSRIECNYCGRKFYSDRIDVHENACIKTKKKRDLFDSKDKRKNEEDPIIDSKKNSKEIKNYTKHLLLNENKNNELNMSKSLDKKANWRIEHENFINNMRNNRNNNNNNSKTNEPAINPNYVFCEFCQRRFAPDTATRHIPKCQNTFNRPNPPKNKIFNDNSEKENTKKLSLTKYVRKNSHSNQMRKYSTHYANDLIHEEDEDKYYNALKYNKKTKLNINNTKFIKENDILSMSKLPELENTFCEISEKIYDPKNYLSADVKSKKNQDKLKTINLENSIFHTNNLKIKYENVMSRSSHYSSIVCPYCERKFAPHASERHIPICQNLLNRGKKLSETIKSFLVKKGNSFLNDNEMFKFGKKITIKNEENLNIFKNILNKAHDFKRLDIKSKFEKTINDNCKRCKFCIKNGHKYCPNCGMKQDYIIKKNN